MLPLCQQERCFHSGTFINLFQHSFGVLNFTNSWGRQIGKTKVPNRMITVTCRLRERRASKPDQLKKQMFPYCCWQKKHPCKIWQQRGPFTAKWLTRLQVNVGEQRPTLSRVGKTTGRATRSGESLALKLEKAKKKWPKSKTASLQDLWMPRKGRLGLPRDLCAKTNVKKKKTGISVK